MVTTKAAVSITITDITDIEYIEEILILMEHPQQAALLCYIINLSMIFQTTYPCNYVNYNCGCLRSKMKVFTIFLI